EFLPAITWHLGQQRALAVGDLVVGQWQNEIFGKGIKKSEGEDAVMVLAIHRVLAHVEQSVVHPAHVPLVAEAETAKIRWLRDHGPRRGLLRYSEGSVAARIDGFVHAPQEIDCFEVFAAAEAIWNPVALLSTVVEVDHGGDGIDPQPVDMVLIEPEQRVAKEIVRHFTPTVV